MKPSAWIPLAASLLLAAPAASAATPGEYFPMTPDEIRNLMREYDKVEAAKQRPAPRPEQRRHTIKTIDLTGGPSGEVATVAMGYATTIIVVGENGEPWPIRNIVPGNQNAITAMPLRKENALSGIIHVQRPWISTNLTLDLAERPEPVVIYLRTVADPTDGQHSIIRVRVPGLPPGSQPLPVRNVTVVDDAITNTLAWSPGDDWKEIPIQDDSLPFQARLWESSAGARYILRLTAGATLRSPNWTAQERSTDGRIHVYEFRKKPVLMVAIASDGTRHNIYPADPVVTLTEGRNEVKATISPSQAVMEMAAVRRDTRNMPSITRSPYRTKPYTATYQATGIQLTGKKRVGARRVSVGSTAKHRVAYKGHATSKSQADAKTAKGTAANTVRGKRDAVTKVNRAKADGAHKNKRPSFKKVAEKQGRPLKKAQKTLSSPSRGSKPTAKSRTQAKAPANTAAKNKIVKQEAKKTSTRSSAPVRPLKNKRPPKLIWELKDARLSEVLRVLLKRSGHSLIWKPSFDYEIPVPVRLTGASLSNLLDQVSRLYGLPITLCRGNHVVVVHPPGTPTAHMTCGNAPALSLDPERKPRRPVTKARERVRESSLDIWVLEERGTF